MDLQNTLVIAVVSAGVVGLLIGYFIARFSGANQSATKLLAELEAKEKELQEYRQAVYEQFSATAQKFKHLNESYSDLHKQLATSASVLCSDGPPEPLALDALSEPTQPSRPNEIHEKADDPADVAPVDVLPTAARG